MLLKNGRGWSDNCEIAAERERGEKWLRDEKRGSGFIAFAVVLFVAAIILGHMVGFDRAMAWIANFF